jgi:uncharacterized repeat protein (TIGR01451 family)
MVAAFLLCYTMMAHAFPATQCAGSRNGSNLNCTANDVSITGMRVVGDTTSCTGGTNITLDLELTVNFQVPDRYDIGIFISNDGKDPQLTVANGGATSCSVSILPLTSPFLNLDPGPWGAGSVYDTCGDGNGSIGGGTGSGIHYMPGVTVPCQSIAGGGGNLYIPFVVSWDNSSSKNSDATHCRTIADPVPSTGSKCNAPTIAQGSVSVVVLPTITNTDGVTFVSSGDTVTYTVIITNTTGVTLSGAVFTDPAVTNINVSSVSCSASGGASCPAATVAAMQGAGIAIPNMPANSSVTFTITATLAGTPPNTLTNTASVTVNSQTKSVSDTDTVVDMIAIIPSSLSKYGTAGTLMVFNYTLYNFGDSNDTISLSALSNNGWTVQIRNAADTATIASLTVLAMGGSADFIVKVQIDPSAALGTVDVTTITATSGNDPTKKATGTAITTVSGPLTITPNNTGAGGKGSSVFYDHRVRNSTASTLTINFTAVIDPLCAPAGWASVLPASITLAPFGGYADIVVRVNIPATAVVGSSCKVTVTATATAGGYSNSAEDTTTVSALVLYSDAGYTDESYIFPAGNRVYARAFGTLTTTNYHFTWSDPTGATRRTSPNWPGAATLPDGYDIPAAGPLGTWSVAVTTSGGAPFASVNFYVGPDHINASYTGTNPVPANTNATINLSLHDRSNPVHVVPFDPFGNLVQGNWPTTNDPLLITVAVNGAAQIVANTLSCAPQPSCDPVGQTVTGRLNNITGTATITITDTVHEAVTITPSSFNAALYGSALVPTRDETAAVNFVIRRMRILYWREMY